jgi:hypothetical protein
MNGAFNKSENWLHRLLLFSKAKIIQIKKVLALDCRAFHAAFMVYSVSFMKAY